MNGFIHYNTVGACIRLRNYALDSGIVIKINETSEFMECAKLVCKQKGIELDFLLNMLRISKS